MTQRQCQWWLQSSGCVWTHIKRVWLTHSLEHLAFLFHWSLNVTATGKVYHQERSLEPFYTLPQRDTSHRPSQSTDTGPTSPSIDPHNARHLAGWSLQCCMYVVPLVWPVWDLNLWSSHTRQMGLTTQPFRWSAEQSDALILIRCTPQTDATTTDAGPTLVATAQWHGSTTCMWQEFVVCFWDFFFSH